MQYLDTSALIALGDKKDKNHTTAVEYLREIVRRGLRFIIGKH
jgi:predicted nucleic acid-binding protein